MLNNPFVRFLFIAATLFIAWFFLFEFIITDHTSFNQFLIESLIDISGGILTVLGFDLIPEPPSDVIIRTIGIDGSTGVWVGDPCSGLEIMVIFIIFMLAIPGPWKSKLWFIPAGLVLIHLINAIRVTVLAWLVSKDYSYLDFNHDYTFKVVIYTLIFFLWVLWVKKFALKKSHIGKNA